MKTTKIFLMAALALTFAACSNDDNIIQTSDKPAKAEGIPFSASISIDNGAATRALTENGTTLEASWAVGEKVALIHNGVSDEMEVESVSGGVATIKGTITGSPANGDAVTVIYPSTAADGTTGNVKADLLYAQDGTLATIASTYEARKGSGTLKVSGTASLEGNVSLTNQFAIFKFTVKNFDASATINVKPLVVTIATQDYVITPASATSTLYAALPAVSSQTVSFSASGSDNKAYTCSKDGVTFAAAKYYQSTLKMAEISGALGGLFSVSASKKAFFSKGNLKYNGSAWSFFDNQYDYLATHDGTNWDKFGWSTSTNYGMSTSTSNDDYSGDFVDWGATMGTGWRTLTSDEWTYLFNSRSASTVGSTENARYAKAKVNNVQGVIFFPDTYTHPSDVTAPTGINETGTAGWNGNNYDATAWGKMESAGCVFLPAAGYREGSSVSGAGTTSCYWSGTACGPGTAYRVYFNSGNLNPAGYIDRHDGYSVRLVRPAE